MEYNEHTAKVQKALGMTGDDVDGKYGAGTAAELKRAVLDGRVTLTIVPRKPDGKSALSKASQEKLEGVNDKLAEVIEEAARRAGVKFDVIEGLRTRERQEYLHQIGATRTKNSRHLTGHAVDLWPLDDKGKRLPSDAAFKDRREAALAADALWDGLRAIAATVKEVAAEKGVKVTWGGDWRSFPDGPHFELPR